MTGRSQRSHVRRPLLFCLQLKPQRVRIIESALPLKLLQSCFEASPSVFEKNGIQTTLSRLTESPLSTRTCGILSVYRCHSKTESPPQDDRYHHHFLTRSSRFSATPERR